MWNFVSITNIGELKIALQILALHKWMSFHNMEDKYIHLNANLMIKLQRVLFKY